MPVNQVYFYSYKSKKRGILWYYLYKEIGVKKFKKVRGFLTKRDAKRHFEETFNVNIDEINNMQRPVITQQYINITEIQNHIDNAVEKAISGITTNNVQGEEIPNIPFANIANHFLEHIEKTGAKATFKNYKRIFDNHLQEFHTKNMPEITRKETKKWRDDKVANKVGGATINYAIKFAKAAINYAIDDEEFDFKFDSNKNPFSIPPAEENYIDKEHLDLEQLFLMLQRCLDMFGFEWFFVYLTISAFTGMRQAEVIGLDVDKIDFDKNIIKVRQQYTRNELKGKLKTKSSYRDVDMFPLLASILKTYIIKKRIFKGALLKGDTGNNRVNSSFMLKKYWKPLKVACGFEKMKGLTPHSLRGCFTDFCLEESIDDKFVQGTLGHSNITTTKNIYAKKTKKMSENYKNKMQEVCEEFTQKLNWNF